MIKTHYRVSELTSLALSKRKETYIKGYDCGFKTGDQYLSYRLGFSTGFYSYSAQGKSQFWIEQAVHLSRKHGLKHAIWLTENGKKEELIMDIAMTYMRKSLFSPNHVISDEELFEALNWMNDFFYIIDHESSILNIRDIFQAVADIEAAYGIKINCVAIDNATNLSREADKHKMMIHEYMNYLMTAINRTSLARNYHTFILFHVGKQDRVECKTTGKKYQAPATHYDIVGGQMVNYLGYQLACVYRPISNDEQVGIINPDTGVPFDLNETHIIISKSKPKAVGTQGQFIIYFDVEKQAYYELLNGNEKYYCGDYDNKFNPTDEAKPSALTPSKKFEDDIF